MLDDSGSLLFFSKVVEKSNAINSITNKPTTNTGFNEGFHRVKVVHIEHIDSTQKTSNHQVTRIKTRVPHSGSKTQKLNRRSAKLSVYPHQKSHGSKRLIYKLFRRTISTEIRRNTTLAIYLEIKQKIDIFNTFRD